MSELFPLEVCPVHLSIFIIYLPYFNEIYIVVEKFEKKKKKKKRNSRFCLPQVSGPPKFFVPYQELC